MFRERYGEESVQEYVAHLHDDLKGKFGHLVEDAAKAGEKLVDRQIQSLQQQIGQTTFEKHGGAIKTALQNGVSGLIAELERMTHETLQYFGVKDSSADAFGVRDADVEVLRKAGVVEKECQAEERFEEILTQNIKYGKNDLTLQRYLGYHREIQSLMRKACA